MARGAAPQCPSTHGYVLVLEWQRKKCQARVALINLICVLQVYGAMTRGDDVLAYTVGTPDTN